MRSIKKLKINESISRKKLVIEEDWFEKYSPVLLYLFVLALISESIVGITSLHSYSKNDKIVGSILYTLTFLTGSWLFYRQLMEKKLITVKSKFNAKEIKVKLLQFAKEERFELYKQDGYCLILNESTGLFGDYKKTRIIFIRDNVVYFCVIQDSYRMNRPVLTTHIFLKRALRKLLN